MLLKSRQRLSLDDNSSLDDNLNLVDNNYFSSIEWEISVKSRQRLSLDDNSSLDDNLNLVDNNYFSSIECLDDYLNLVDINYFNKDWEMLVESRQRLYHMTYKSIKTNAPGRMELVEQNITISNGGNSKFCNSNHIEISNFVSVNATVFQGTSANSYIQIVRLYSLINEKRVEIDKMLDSQPVYALGPYFKQDYSVLSIACWVTKPLNELLIKKLSDLFDNKYDIVQLRNKDINSNAKKVPNDNDNNLSKSEGDDYQTSEENQGSEGNQNQENQNSYESSEKNVNDENGEGNDENRNGENGIGSENSGGNTNNGNKNGGNKNIRSKNNENGGGDGDNNGKSNAENDQFIRVISAAIVKGEVEDEVKKEEFQSFNIDVRIRANIKRNILSFSIELIGCGTKCFIKNVSPIINNKFEELGFTVEDTYSPLKSKDHEWEMEIKECPINGPTWSYKLRSDIEINFDKIDHITCPELHKRLHSGKWLLEESVKEFRITVEQKLNCKITPTSPDKPDKQPQLTRFLITCLPRLTHKLEVSFKVNDMTKFNEDFAELVKNLGRDKRILDINLGNTNTLKANREFKNRSNISNGSSEVKRAYLENTNTHFVIKLLNEYDSDKYYERFNREIMNLKKIDSYENNENVIGFYGITKEPFREFYSMVLQYCGDKTLREHLKEECTSKKGWKYKVEMATNIANGLKYIHTANIVHCNLKECTSIEEVISRLKEIEFDHVYQDSDYIPEISYGNRNNYASVKDACLTVIQGSSQNKYFFLPQYATTFIGRNKSNDIIIKDQEIARKHACIECFQGSVVIYDLGFEPGISVNDKRLIFHFKRALEKEDKIKIGRSVFQYLPAGEYENRIDKLLPIYNKKYLLKSLEKEFNSAKEDKQNLSLIFFDLDNFKRINDNNSHGAGDYALKELANLIQSHLCPEDIFARFGGDEFTIILKNTNSELASEYAEKIRKAVESHSFIYDEKRLPATLSIGVAEIDSSVACYEDLLKQADQALNIAKCQGKNRALDNNVVTGEQLTISAIRIVDEKDCEMGYEEISSK
ncbi:2238_t:CDS:2 [Dentiscutata erythropus]|uniref:2238_t:CDS:1 n=1 Tax=Dentiscutata erythropus TaxID=1348616 RepID=A0A9N8ZP15_9GLOM|nr:2238_t:CDS:2 [Dentiscutata erythropus]